MQRIFITFLLIASVNMAKAQEKGFIFSQSSIGSLKLVENMDISLYRLTKAFPFYRITQEIGQGDSPDFHRFVVSNWDGEELVHFISFITDEGGYEKSVVQLDEVMSCSRYIVDEFGVHPKDHLKVAYEARSDMKYGDGHMDNFVGKGKLWYLFSVPNGEFSQGNEEKAKERNPQIDCISWPYARWR